MAFLLLMLFRSIKYELLRTINIKQTLPVLFEVACCVLWIEEVDNNMRRSVHYRYSPPYTCLELEKLNLFILVKSYASISAVII